MNRILAMVLCLMVVFSGVVFASGDFSDVVEVTSSVFSVPDGTVKSAVGEAVVYGNTLFQEADNGVDYGNWSVDAGSLKGSNGIHLVQNGTSEQALINLNIKPSTVYTIFYRITDATATTLTNVDETGCFTQFSVFPVNIGWNKIVLTTQETITHNRIKFQITSAGGADGTYIDFTDFMIFEGDQTANTGIDHYLKYGVKSTKSVVVKSVGKNLLSHNFQQRDTNVMLYDDGNDFIIFNNNGSTTVRASSYIPVYLESGKTYRIYKLNEEIISGSGICFGYNVYDRNKNQLYTKSFSTGIQTFSSDYSGLYYIAPYSGASGTGSIVATDFKCQLMLIDNSLSDTSYANYENSEVFFNGELNSIQDSSGNIVNRDKADFIIGEYTQNTNKVILDGTRSWALAATNTSTYKFYVDILDMQAAGGSVEDVYLEGFNFDDNTALDDEHFYTIASSRIVIVIDQTKIDGLSGTTTTDKFLAWLSTNQPTLIYQLATPTTEQLTTTPLIVYPNGTITIEPAIQDVGIYDNGITITDTDFPIESIESVTKIEYDTDGNRNPTTVSSSDITPSDTTFTIEDASEDDRYEYVYYYDSSLTTIPTFEYSVAVTQEGAINGNTDAIQRNGELIEMILEQIQELMDKVE